jgi:2-polyprenyl-3-methyl-5-hydroxy-6-metoxy-1,4-benzoquinol methylase
MNWARAGRRPAKRAIAKRQRGVPHGAEPGTVRPGIAPVPADTRFRFDVDSVDRFARRAALRFTQAPPPLQRTLTPIRREAMLAALAPRQARSEALAQRMQNGDPAARGELAALAAKALDSMRADVRARARNSNIFTRLVARGDDLWHNAEGRELLDDSGLDVEIRTGIMSALDEFNEWFANYDRFLAELLPLAHPERPTRVLDLAAGHGGFALAAARACRGRRESFRFTASDIKKEYLDLGAAIAEREALPVEFVVQDAFDLGDLEAGAYDIIVCTQSLHHFPPGLVSVMFGAATRAAARGVVFTDGCRSALAGFSALLYGTLRLHNPAWVHDAWVSLRRCYVPEELELLARIADPAGAIESDWLAPGNCVLRRSTLEPA